MQQHQFKLDNDADINHTSFAGLLDKDLDLVIQTFEAGPGFPMEIDSGYEDKSWTFVLVGDESMVFNCYRRWGRMRVSCRQNARHLVDDFKAWLACKGFSMGPEKIQSMLAELSFLEAEIKSIEAEVKILSGQIKKYLIDETVPHYCDRNEQRG